MSIYVPDALSLVSSTPANNDTAATISKTISMVFNNDIDIQNIISSNIVLSDTVGGTIPVDSYEFITGTKTLKAYLHEFMNVGAAYTIRLNGVPDIGGNKLADTLINFSTIVPPLPVVLQNTPLNNEIDVSPSKKLTITFNTHMDESSFKASNIRIVNTSTNAIVPWVISSYNDVDYKLEITPTLDLSSTYRVELTGVKSFYGNVLTDFNFNFSTASADFTDDQVVKNVLDNININGGKMIDASIMLPTNGQYGTSIKWTVPINDYITASGVLKTQPQYVDGAKEITLTATVTYGSIQSIRDYIVKIKPTPNVVKNSGFENDFISWVGLTGGLNGAQATISDVAHSGSKSCLVPLRVNNTARMRYAFADGELLHNKKYYVSVWAKQKESAIGTAYQLNFYTYNTRLLSNQSITLTNDWQKLTNIVMTDAVDSYGVLKPINGEVFQFMNFANNPMTYYMDDFVVERALPYNISVNGDNKLPVPVNNNPVIANYTSEILNQFGNSDEMSSETVSWSLPNNNTGVTIDATGTLTVNSSAIVGDTVTIRATNNTYSWLYTDYNVTLVNQTGIPPQANYVSITPTTTMSDKTGALVGDVITGKYQYYDINDNAEGDSTYDWVAVDNEDAVTGSVLAGGHITNGQVVSYTIKGSDINKIIKLVITPRSVGNPANPTMPTTGIPAGSNIITVRAVPEARNLKITGTPMSLNTLVGSYVYSSPNGYPEGATVTGWYSGDTLLGTGTSYTVRGYEGIITFKVTPVSTVEPYEGRQEGVFVTIEPRPTVFLDNLTVTPGIMSTPFAPSRTTYNIYVPQNATTVELKPTFASGTLKNSGVIWDSNSSQTVSLTGIKTTINLYLNQPKLDTDTFTSTLSVMYVINVIKLAEGIIATDMSIYGDQQVPAGGGQYNIKSTYVNNSIKINSVYYILSVKSNNRLIDTKIVSKTFAPNEVYTFDNFLMLPSKNISPNLEIKAFMWNDMDKLIPCSLPMNLYR